MIDVDRESSMPHPSLSAKALPPLLIALGIALPSPARGAEPPADAAEPSSSARIAELNETGARAYAERHYRAAIEKFVEAYAIDHDPNLLFNIARCYEKLGDLGAAIEKYEAFVAAPGADTEGRIKAKESLAELRQLEQQGGVTPVENAGPGEAGAGSPPSAAEGAPGVNIWPWLTLGTGVVVTGVGVTVYALGAHDHSLVTDAKGYGDPSVVYPMTRAEAQSYIDSGNTKKLVGGIALGVGGALVVTGVVWLVTGKRDAGASAQAASFTLAPSRDGVLAGYAGRF